MLLFAATAVLPILFRHLLEMPQANGQLPSSALLAYLFPPGATLLAGFCMCVIGYLLLNASGGETRSALPRQDSVLLARLILDEKEQGIKLYVTLSSLSGFTGVFTKIGFTGLPLATMGLTLLLTILSITTQNDHYIQMAQLTLGAFIGSFVERRQTTPPVDDANLTERRRR
jgi:hypothetical protein